MVHLIAAIVSSLGEVNGDIQQCRSANGDRAVAEYSIADCRSPCARHSCGSGWTVLCSPRVQQHHRGDAGNAPSVVQAAIAASSGTLTET
ncbi:hypothetical protein B0H12DRAFT_1237048 [Mycena haematopus]|nr:hypothetical protein B0H12DRAFT_1237048 [Mycena haematopus]